MKELRRSGQERHATPHRTLLPGQSRVAESHQGLGLSPHRFTLTYTITAISGWITVRRNAGMFAHKSFLDYGIPVAPRPITHPAPTSP